MSMFVYIYFDICVYICLCVCLCVDIYVYDCVYLCVCVFLVFLMSDLVFTTGLTEILIVHHVRRWESLLTPNLDIPHSEAFPSYGVNYKLSSVHKYPRRLMYSY